MKSLKSVGLPLVCLLLAATFGNAQVSYQYRGNNYNQFSCGPSGGGGILDCSTPGPGQTTYTRSEYVYANLTLSNPLPPNLLMQDITTLPGFQLTLNDSHQTLSWPDPTTIVQAKVSTDANGNIIAPWFFWIFSRSNPPDNGIYTANASAYGYGVEDFGDVYLTSTPTGDFGLIMNSPGLWFGVRSGTAAWNHLEGGVFGLPFPPRDRIYGNDNGGKTVSSIFEIPAGSSFADGKLGGAYLLDAGAWVSNSGECVPTYPCSSAIGGARGLVYETFYNSGPDVTLRLNAYLDGQFKNTFGGEAYAALYAVDADVFDNTVPSGPDPVTGTAAAKFLLSSSSLSDFNGHESQLSLAGLFPSILGSSTPIVQRDQPVIPGTLNVPVQTGLFTIKAGEKVTVIFDVAAYSPAGGSTEGTATVNFANTLAPASVFFTDANGNPVTQIQAIGPSAGPVQVPATLTLAPSSTTNPVGVAANITVTEKDSNGNPVPDATVYFSLLSGPDSPLTVPQVTDANGHATLTYDGSGAAGTDTIQATATGVTSNSVTVTWTVPGPFDHVGITPQSSTIAVGGSQDYATQSLDKFNNVISTVTGSTVFTISPDGSCTGASCTASIAGPHMVTATYNGKTAQASLNVGTTSSQTITFNPPASPVTYGASPVTLSATGGASGNPVTLSVSGPGSLNGNILTITGAGTISITANQAGNSNYTAADPVTRSIVVNPAPLAVTAPNLTKVLNATNPSLNNVSYSGFQNNDGPANLGGALNCTTTATTASAVGSYPITCSGQTSDNYTITYHPGTLKVQYAAAGGACVGSAGHIILPPINFDGTSVWKEGRTIPAQFRVCDANGASIGTPGVVTSFNLIQIAAGTVTDVDESVDSTNSDSSFHWDSAAQQWIFNISTKPLSAGYTYVYAITLNDGTTINFQYGLK